MDIHLNHFHTALSGKGRAITVHPTQLEGLNLLLALKLDETDTEQAVDFAQKCKQRRYQRQIHKRLLIK